MRVIRGAALSALAVTSLLALAACGSNGGSSAASGNASTPNAGTGTASAPAGGGRAPAVANAVSALDAVVARTGKEHSARIESSMKVAATLSTLSKGTMDWEHGTRAEMSVTYTGGTVADSLRSAGVGSSMQARYLSDAYYVNMGPKTASQLGGRHWIRYAYADLAKSGGGSGAYMADQLQNNDPTRSVQYILASPDVHKVGTETVRGVPATHYSGTLNVDDVTKQTSVGMTAAQLAQLHETLQTAGVTTEKVDLWVSADNLPVKAVSTAQASTGETDSTTYYSDFGVRVGVVTPPAGDWRDFTALTQ